MMDFILEMQFSSSIAMFSGLRQEEIHGILYFIRDFSITLFTITKIKFVTSSFSEKKLTFCKISQQFIATEPSFYF